MLPMLIFFLGELGNTKRILSFKHLILEHPNLPTEKVLGPKHIA